MKWWDGAFSTGLEVGGLTNFSCRESKASNVHFLSKCYVDTNLTASRGRRLKHGVTLFLQTSGIDRASSRSCARLCFRTTGGRAILRGVLRNRTLLGPSRGAVLPGFVLHPFFQIARKCLVLAGRLPGRRGWRNPSVHGGQSTVPTEFSGASKNAVLLLIFGRRPRAALRCTPCIRAHRPGILLNISRTDWPASLEGAMSGG